MAERSSDQRSHPAQKKKQTRTRPPAEMDKKQADAWRRSRASRRELDRIHTLADALEDLRAVVPKSADEEQATKAELLRQASSYIELLGELVEAPPGPDACSTAVHQFGSATSLMQLGDVSSLDMPWKLEERQQLLSQATQPALQPPAVASAAFASAPPGGSVPVLQVAQSYHPNHLTLSAPTARTPPVDFLSSIQSPIIPVAPSPWSVSQASHPAGYEVQSRPITLSTGPPYTQLQQPSPHHPNIYHLASTTAASQPVHWSMATGTAANTPGHHHVTHRAWRAECFPHYAVKPRAYPYRPFRFQQEELRLLFNPPHMLL
ncbi:uncharacterized protein LOC135814150 isoform X3 [Sycon ciliatum]|uniref:uncharacterized protein LOC135814150 isoform X3 n=1 Tax=Sycon ciliatum TaxID=27933 RepID=UPI0031F613CC